MTLVAHRHWLCEVAAHLATQRRLVVLCSADVATRAALLRNSVETRDIGFQDEFEITLDKDTLFIR